MKISAHALTKTYGATAALDGLSLQVDDVRTLVLIGPSGGGKSTLLRVLGGLEASDAGSLTVNNQSIDHDPARLLAYRRKNGFLFQQFNLFPHLSALENITLPLERVQGMTAGAAHARACETLDRFGLLDHGHKRPAQLSGGQQQRVGLARAVAAKPEVLFLDEPTSALDPEMTAEVLELIEELAAAGQDIILSTHEMGFAKAVADRVVFLAAGRLEECGAPAEVFDAPRSEACRRFFSRVMKW